MNFLLPQLRRRWAKRRLNSLSWTPLISRFRSISYSRREPIARLLPRLCSWFSIADIGDHSVTSSYEELKNSSANLDRQASVLSRSASTGRISRGTSAGKPVTPLRFFPILMQKLFAATICCTWAAAPMAMILPVPPSSWWIHPEWCAGRISPRIFEYGPEPTRCLPRQRACVSERPLVLDAIRKI